MFCVYMCVYVYDFGSPNMGQYLDDRKEFKSLSNLIIVYSHLIQMLSIQLHLLVGPRRFEADP